MKKNFLVGFIIVVLIACIAVEGFFIFKSYQEKNENSENNENIVEQTPNNDVKSTPVATPKSTPKATPKATPKTNDTEDDDKIEINDGDLNITISKKYTTPKSNDVVYTAISANVTRTDNSSNNSHKEVYKYFVPQINSISSYAKKVNDEIMKIYKNDVEDFIKQNKTINFEAESIAYEYYENDDIISLVVEVPTESGGYTGYYIYNFDEEGNEISNKEVLEQAKVKENEFNDKLIEKIKELYELNSLDKNITDEQMIDVKNKTVEKYKGKSSDDLKLFINNEGNLSAYLTIYVIAGGGENNILLDLETGERIYIEE